MSYITFAIEGDDFVRNGKKHRIFSGALHYFRVPPEYWEDRLLKYRACGLNTVETYLPWNLHEPKPGEFRFDEILDVRRFVQLAGSLGLDVIVRPGPYICAEWEGGGLPGWLLADPGMRLRSQYPPFMEATARYLRRVAEELRDLQCTRGGPIIAMQVENEYGSYGSDLNYLAALEQITKDSGIEVLLFSSDGAEGYTLEQGTLPHLFKTANFGSRAKDAFEQLRRVQPTGPMMCMEFWVGWFDHWGTEHHVRSAEDAVKALEEILSLKGSFNIYMMHGGTNFGFMNGANCSREYLPTVSSYDYDAPLNERGEPTAKYFAFREVLAKQGAKIEPVPESEPAKAYGKLVPSESCDLFDFVAKQEHPIRSSYTLTMEEVGQNYGYILYRSRLRVPHQEFVLYLAEVSDRALIYQNGKFCGVVDRNSSTPEVQVEAAADVSQLDILVENLGRVNHGRKIHDRKGLPQGARRYAQLIPDWEIYPLEWEECPQLSDWKPYGGEEQALAPRFYRANLEVETCQDTFLKVRGEHGAVWVNGRCLGRYWKKGPQQTLFLPGPFLRTGTNEIVVLDLESNGLMEMEFLADPELG